MRLFSALPCRSSPSSLPFFAACLTYRYFYGSPQVVYRTTSLYWCMILSLRVLVFIFSYEVYLSVLSFSFSIYCPSLVVPLNYKYFRYKWGLMGFRVPPFPRRLPDCISRSFPSRLVSSLCSSPILSLSSLSRHTYPSHLSLYPTTGSLTGLLL